MTALNFTEVPTPRSRFRCKYNPLPAEYQQGESFDLQNNPLYRGIRVEKDGDIYQFVPPTELTSDMVNIPYLVSETAGTLDLSAYNDEDYFILLPIYSNGRMFSSGEVAAKGSKLFDPSSDEWFEYTRDDSVVGNRSDDFIKKFNYHHYIEGEVGYIRPNVSSSVWRQFDPSSVDESTNTVCEIDPLDGTETCYTFIDAPGHITSNFSSGMAMRYEGSFYYYSGTTVTPTSHTIDDVMDSVRYRVWVNDPDSSVHWSSIPSEDFFETGNTFQELSPGSKLKIGSEFYMLVSIPDFGGTPYYQSINDSGNIDIDETGDLWVKTANTYQLSFTDVSQTGVATPDDKFVECPMTVTDETEIYETMKTQFLSLQDDDEHNILNYVSCWIDLDSMEIVFDAEKNQHDQWQWFQIAGFSNMNVSYEEIV